MRENYDISQVKNLGGTLANHNPYKWELIITQLSIELNSTEIW